MLTIDQVQRLGSEFFPNNFKVEDTEFGFKCLAKKEVNGTVHICSYYVNMDELGFNEEIFKKTVLKLLQRALERETADAQ